VTERGSEEATTPTPGHVVVGEPTDDPEIVAAHPRRGTVRFAWGATVVILIGVVVLLVYAFSAPSNPTEVVRRSPTSPAILSEIRQIPGSVFDTVGVSAPTTPVTAPSVVNGPALVEAGKPAVLYVGAEFCSFCAAERWALVVALSRFGQFTSLANMQSAPQSAFPSIQSFSFVGAGYTSSYLAFRGIELYSNAVDTGPGPGDQPPTPSSTSTTCWSPAARNSAPESSPGCPRERSPATSINRARRRPRRSSPRPTTSAPACAAPPTVCPRRCAPAAA
jgi:Domain of unknown function (DUF929)